jgi:hypothetical protein
VGAVASFGALIVADSLGVALAASTQEKGGGMPVIARATMYRRRQRQEEGYEKLIVNMARTIVDPKTSEERRTKAQDSLLNACAKISAFHSLNASALYWGAIKRATQEGSS